MSLSDRQLNKLAKRLGDRAGVRIDVEGTATAVVRRLRGEPPRDSRWQRQSPVYGALAAAAAVILAVGLLSNGGASRARGVFDLARAPVELQALSFEELEEVYDSLSFEAPVSELAVADLDDMSVGQLEELLQTLMED